MIRGGTALTGANSSTRSKLKTDIMTPNGYPAERRRRRRRPSPAGGLCGRTKEAATQDGGNSDSSRFSSLYRLSSVPSTREIISSMRARSSVPWMTFSES